MGPAESGLLGKWIGCRIFTHRLGMVPAGRCLYTGFRARADSDRHQLRKRQMNKHAMVSDHSSKISKLMRVTAPIVATCLAASTVLAQSPTPSPAPNPTPAPGPAPG